MAKKNTAKYQETWSENVILPPSPISKYAQVQAN